MADDLGHKCGVLGRKREPRVGGPRPLEEERDRRVLGQIGRRERSGRVGDRQRQHWENLLAGEAQHDAAGGEDRQARAGGQEGGEVGRGGNHLLQVIEHEQQAPAAEHKAQALGERPVTGFLYAQRLSDRRKDEGRVADRSETDEPNSIREGLSDLDGHGLRQPRLPHATGAGQGDERHVGAEQQGTDGLDFVLAADQGRQRSWEARDGLFRSSRQRNQPRRIGGRPQQGRRRSSMPRSIPRKVIRRDPVHTSVQGGG